jgi:orotidine-5'-phosphate decarboxylase
MPPDPADGPLRDRLALALDVDDLVAANRLVKELKDWFGVFKVGLELYSAAGPDAVLSLVDQGCRVFLDVKLHDIPTTVGRAARVMGAFGASYITLHAMGGVAMLRAGVDGMTEGAFSAGLPAPAGLAVTVLTSDGTAPPHILGDRVRRAVEGGCLGVVCAASDAAEVKQLAPDLTAVVPGIRLAGGSKDDQAQVATPAAALAAGADMLVVGRAVTAAPDRAAAAAALVASIGQEA